VASRACETEASESETAIPLGKGTPTDRLRPVDRDYAASWDGRNAVTDKPKRLEAANFERAEKAIEWEVAENKADETGRTSDKAEANVLDGELDAADRKIKKIRAEP
jgi:hypothetical protein